MNELDKTKKCIYSMFEFMFLNASSGRINHEVFREFNELFGEELKKLEEGY